MPESPSTFPKILILDDEKDFCDLFKFQFEKEGFKVLVASRSQQGLELIIREAPRCVLLDIRLSQGEDGLTCLRKIRGYRDDNLDLQKKVRLTPVLILTSAGSHMKTLFEAEGIQGYIEKPFDVKQLKELLLKQMA